MSGSQSPQTATAAATASNASRTAGFVSAAQIASGAAGAYAELAAGELSADTLRYDAKLDDLAARSAERRGILDINKIRRAGHQLIGAQRQAYAANNFVVDTGTPVETVADTQATIDHDVETTRLNSMLEAFGHRVDQSDNRAKARLALSGARNRAGQTLITSVDKASTTYRKLTE